MFTCKFVSLLAITIALLGLSSPTFAAGNERSSATADQQDHLLKGDRVVKGTVEKVTGDQIQVNTGEMQPRYLPLTMAKEKNLPPIKEGDQLEIVLNDQNLVVDYHPVGMPLNHRRVVGELATSMVVGHDRAVIKTKDGKEESYEVRPMARSKMSTIPIGSQAVFLIDEANQIADVVFGNEMAVGAASDEFKGSPPKGAQSRLAGTIVRPLERGRISIKTKEGKEQLYEIRPPVQDKLAKIPPGEKVELLIDSENKVVDVAFVNKERGR